MADGDAAAGIPTASPKKRKSKKSLQPASDAAEGEKFQKRRRRSREAVPAAAELPSTSVQAADGPEDRRQSGAAAEVAQLDQPLSGDAAEPLGGDSGTKQRERSAAEPAAEPTGTESRGQGGAQTEAAPDAPGGQPVLPWMQLPIEVEQSGGVPLASVRGLDPRLHAALLKGGFQELYPVQAAAWALLAGGFSDAHDLCICVPTGSGKTLAYALPLLQGLTQCPDDALGALIVLPTRELAVQVWTVLAALSPALGLRTGLAAARLPLASEAAAFRQRPPAVLVATPGRLMAHLTAERPVFSLAALRFLVVDETDRLLRQGYQQWLPHVVSATSNSGDRQLQTLQGERVVKIVVSATLTQDPAKIGRLMLQAPRYIALRATRRYKVPPQLREWKLACAAADKPLVLLALLSHLRVSKAIVFTGSLIATRRLCMLLRCFPGFEGAAAEHSSRTAARGGGSEGLAAFRRGEARVLVASDALTRGMDIPDVDVVVNYDPAAYPKTYVHRAGRTARAGRPGTVVSLLTPEQVRHFKALLRKVDNTYVRDLALPARLVASLRPAFQGALERAGELDEE